MEDKNIKDVEFSKKSTRRPLRADKAGADKVVVVVKEISIEKSSLRLC